MTVRTSSRRCGSSSGSPAGTTAVPPGRRPAISSAFAAAIASMRAEQLEVHRADVDDHADVGLGDRAPARRSGRRRASPSRARAPRCRRGAPRTVSGRPISVLRFCARGDDRARCGASIAARRSFVEVLPVEPVIADDLRAERAAPRAWRAAAARRAGRRRRAARRAGAQRAASACSGATSTPHAPAASACAAKRPPSTLLAGEADEQVAGADVARVDRPRGPAPGCVRRAGATSRAPRGLRRRAQATSRARSASRATVDVVERAPCARPRTPGPARGPCRR